MIIVAKHIICNKYISNFYSGFTWDKKKKINNIMDIYDDTVITLLYFVAFLLRYH